MKRILSPRAFGIVLAVLFASVQPAVGQPKEAPSFKMSCEKADALYHVGESAKFKIDALEDVEFCWVASKDGFTPIDKGTGKLTKGKSSEVSGKLDAPGLLQIRVTAGKEQHIAAVGFDPTRIEPTAKMPKDFDIFWDAGKEELAKVPIDVKLEHVAKLSDDRVDCFKISLSNMEGKRV
ncbi:MAG TPA: acetylxylan esterase [Gemmataceae bacterium]|jgi:hypothetical protein|nr:acetylxylan esterase [Gemmataceae bacterium]